MSFTFTARPSPIEPKIPPDPPNNGGKGGTNENSKHMKSSVSFRDKVLGNHAIMEKEKVDLIANKMAQVELVKGNRLMPMLHVENSVIEDLCVPWRDALVIKLLGKNLGYNTMKTKLENVWKLSGGFELMDIGYSYYMVKFDGEDDKNKVINGGPWMIYDHYLAVSQWSPTFNAATATIDKTMVWIRIPSLNLVYYDESILWALASMIGNPVKVDLHTLRVARGRFARICVEVDLTIPVVGRVGINGEWYQVQYEGLHIICTQCGCYGHVLKDCAVKIKSATNVESNKAVEGEKTVVDQSAATILNADGNEPVHKVGEDGSVNHAGKEDFADHNNDKKIPEILHGEWIKVERRKKSNKLNGGRFGGMFRGLQNQHSNLDILNMVGKVDMQRHMEKEDENNKGALITGSKNMGKKKRVWNDTSGLNNTKPNNSNNTTDPSSSMGVYKGGYTAVKVKNNPTKVHVGKYSNFKVDKKFNNNIKVDIPISQLQHIDLDMQKKGASVPLSAHPFMNSSDQHVKNVKIQTSGESACDDGKGQLDTSSAASANDIHMSSI
jgi:hypothetical protein